MNIHNISQRIKSYTGPNSVETNSETFSFDESGRVANNKFWPKIYLAIVIILLSILSFGLGRLSVPARSGITIEKDIDISAIEDQTSAVEASQTPSDSTVTASSQGTKYYYANCHNTISDKNKISFATPALAEAAGYTLAANCSPK